MTQSDAAFWMAVIGTACWGVCFWWMKRISAEQYRLMDQLREQGRRIEQLSTIEHDLIKEVHPQVGEIREGMGEMIAVVKENSEEMIAAVKESPEGVSPAPLEGLREPPNGVHNPGNQREPTARGRELPAQPSARYVCANSALPASTNRVRATDVPRCLRGY